MTGKAQTLDEYFLGYPQARQIFDALQVVIDAIGANDLRVTKSQVTFRHGRSFAWAWIPAKYLHGKTAPLVLSLSLPARDDSPRWKEIVEPYPGRFMHHLELFEIVDIDAQVIAWLKQAWHIADQE